MLNPLLLLLLLLIFTFIFHSNFPFPQKFLRFLLLFLLFIFEMLYFNFPPQLFYQNDDFLVIFVIIMILTILFFLFLAITATTIIIAAIWVWPLCLFYLVFSVFLLPFLSVLFPTFLSAEKPRFFKSLRDSISEYGQVSFV